MDHDELRSLTNKYYADHKKQETVESRRERAGMIIIAETRCENAARNGRSEAVVCTIQDYREDLLHIPEDCRASMIDDELEVLERAQRNLANIGVDHLIGNAAELRDYLKIKKLSLSMKIRDEGDTCNSSHNVWDLIAHW